MPQDAPSSLPHRQFGRKSQRMAGLCKGNAVRKALNGPQDTCSNSLDARSCGQDHACCYGIAYACLDRSGGPVSGFQLRAESTS